MNELARGGANETLTDALASWTYQLWQLHFQTKVETEQGLAPLFYVDGHHKAVYTDKLIPRGLVGRFGKILGCRAIVLLHDSSGHPLLALIGRSDQHLTMALPQIVARFERSNGPHFKISRIVADREAMAGEFLANALLAGQTVVTLLER